MYEALRAYFLEGRASHEVARAFGYSPGSFRVLCHQFRREREPQFFVSPAPGPRAQPKKSKAREMAVALRKQNHSVYEIAEALKANNMILSPTAVRELLRAEGFGAVCGRGHGAHRRAARIVEEFSRPATVEDLKTLIRALKPPPRSQGRRQGITGRGYRLATVAQ